MNNLTALYYDNAKQQFFDAPADQVCSKPFAQPNKTEMIRCTLHLHMKVPPMSFQIFKIGFTGLDTDLSPSYQKETHLKDRSPDFQGELLGSSDNIDYISLCRNP